MQCQSCNQQEYLFRSGCNCDTFEDLRDEKGEKLQNTNRWLKVAIQADSLRGLVSTNALITAGLLKVKSAVLAFFRTPLIVAVPLKGANTRMCIEVGGTGAKFTDRWCFGIRHSYLVAVIFF